MKVYKKKQFSQINIFPSNYKNILNRSNSLLNNNKISSNIKNYYNTIYLNNNNNNNFNKNFSQNKINKSFKNKTIQIFNNDLYNSNNLKIKKIPNYKIVKRNLKNLTNNIKLNNQKLFEKEFYKNNITSKLISKYGNFLQNSKLLLKSNNNSFNNSILTINDEYKSNMSSTKSKKNKISFFSIFNSNSNSMPNILNNNNSFENYYDDNYYNNEIINKNEKKFLKNIKNSKLTLKTNDIIFTDKSSFKNFSNSCTNIILIKNYQTYQKQKLKSEKNNNFNKLLNKISYYQSLISLSNKITENYKIKIKKYNNFVFIKKIKLIEENDLLKEIKFDLQITVDKILTKCIQTQQKLNYFINIRNLLIKIKENILFLPKKFLEISYSQTKIELLYKTISNMKTKLNIYLAKKFMKETKNLILKHKNSFLNKEKFNFIINDNNNNNLNKEEDLCEYLKENKKIFKNAQALIDKIYHLREKNINLLYLNQIIYKNLNLVKREFNKIEEENNNYNNIIDENIISNENKLKILIYKNKILNNQLININKRNNLNKNKSIKNFNKIIFDIDSVIEKKYNNLIENAENDYQIFLTKLYKSINNFLKYNNFNFNIDNIYNIVDQIIYNKIENLVKSNFKIKKENKNILNYSLILLKLYEKIIEYTLNKYNDIKKNNISNEIIFKKAKEEIKRKRNKNKANLIKNLIEEKRIEQLKIEFKNSNKIIFKPKRKVNEKIQIKNKILLSNNNNNNNMNKEKNYYFKDLNNLILFS